MANLTQPMVSWYWDYKATDGSTKQDKVGLYGTSGGTLGLWDLGTVKAGNAANSDDTSRTFYIWNNKGGGASGTDVAPKMAECQLTIRDDTDTTNGYTQGNADSPLVKGEWIKARIYKSRKGATGTVADPYESIGSWTPIGLNTDGHTVDYLNFEALGMRGAGTTDTFASGQIDGSANIGDFVTDACRNNYAKIDMKMEVPSGALAGMVYFIARIYYTAI